MRFETIHNQFKENDLVEIDVEIGEWEIRNGLKRNCKFCPTTLALYKYLHNCAIVTQFDQVQLFGEKDKFFSHRLSNELYAWVAEFDYGRKAKPFNFKMKFPASVIRETPISLELEIGDFKKTSWWANLFRWFTSILSVGKKPAPKKEI